MTGRIYIDEIKMDRAVIHANAVDSRETKMNKAMFPRIFVVLRTDIYRDFRSSCQAKADCPIPTRCASWRNCLSIVDTLRRVVGEALWRMLLRSCSTSYDGIKALV